MRSLLGLAALAALQIPTQDAANGVYVTSHGNRIEVVGVCQIDPESSRCWDLAGAPAPEIVRAVDAYYERQEIRFVPGERTRYVVYRRKPNGYYRFTDAEDREAGPVWPRLDERPFDWSRVAVAPNAATFDVFLTLPAARPLPPEDLPLTKGAKRTVAGIAFEVGDVRPSPDPFLRRDILYLNSWGRRPESRPTRGWLVTLDQEGSKPASVNTRLELVDKAGKPILYIDPQNRPISEVAYLQGRAEGGPDAEVYQPVGFYPLDYRRQNAPRRVYQTNVDPSLVGAIRIHPAENLRVRFANLPAEPRAVNR